MKTFGAVLRLTMTAIAAALVSGCVFLLVQDKREDRKPTSVLVIETASLRAFAAAARKRPGAPATAFRAVFSFQADADPAWCKFDAAYRAANPEPRGPVVDVGNGAQARREKRRAAYASAKAAAGVTADAPRSMSFETEFGAKVFRRPSEALAQWSFLTARELVFSPRLGESAALVFGSFSGYALIALTSGEARSVPFFPSAPMSFTRPQAELALIGPFRLIVDGDRFRLIHLPGAEAEIRAEAARWSARPIDEVVFAPLDADIAKDCVDYTDIAP